MTASPIAKAVSCTLKGKNHLGGVECRRCFHVVMGARTETGNAKLRFVDFSTGSRSPRRIKLER